MTLLKFYIKTKEQRYLERAIQIGEQLINAMNKTEDGHYWIGEKGVINIGYKYGNSGIALFLLYLYLATNDDVFLHTGYKGLEFDLKYKAKEESYNCYSFPRDTVNKYPMYPYFFEGTAGILSVLLRYNKILNSKQLDVETIKLADSICIKYAISPNLYMGLAGLGNTLLDCYQLLHLDKYKKQAYKLAEGISLYQVKYKDKILFPDNNLMKLSTDLGYGSMGILMFYKRLINNDNNFCFFLDSLFN